MRRNFNIKKTSCILHGAFFDGLNRYFIKAATIYRSLLLLYIPFFEGFKFVTLKVSLTPLFTGTRRCMACI